MADDRYLVPIEHEEVLVRRGARSGLYSIVAVHSTRRGPALGGCRMWRYDDTRVALRDALRLARGMTYKSAVAGLDLGGGKGVIALPPDAAPPTGRARRDVLLDFGDAVDVLGGRYVTAEDVGTATRDMTTIARATTHVTGLPRRAGGSGDPSPHTALGVEAAVLATCERAFGSASLRGRSVAVVGLGHVGLRVARLLARRGRAAARRRHRPGQARAGRGPLGARWVTPARALTAPVDVLAPCALGGVLDHDSVPRLQAQAIAGAANNQLADDSVGELLQARGILWAPDFVANAGGIINIAVELGPGGYDPARARRDVRAIADTLREVYDRAASAGTTPLSGGDGPRREQALRPLGVARREPQRVAAGRHAHRLAVRGRRDEPRLGAEEVGRVVAAAQHLGRLGRGEPERLGGERLAHVAGRVAPLQARAEVRQQDVVGLERLEAARLQAPPVAR